VIEGTQTREIRVFDSLVKNSCPPGVNFINLLRAAFVRADPKSAKKIYSLTVFFGHSGSSSVKAAGRTLIKLTAPGLNFISIPRTAFMPVAPQSVRTQSSHQYLFTLLGPMSVKAVHRTLMKLTPGQPEIT